MRSLSTPALVLAVLLLSSCHQAQRSKSPPQGAQPAGGVPVGPGGPIAQLYQVTSWPTVYVLDGNGVVRYRDVRGADLDRAVEALLRERLAPLAPVGVRGPSSIHRFAFPPARSVFRNSSTVP